MHKWLWAVKEVSEEYIRLPVTGTVVQIWSKVKNGLFSKRGKFLVGPVQFHRRPCVPIVKRSHHFAKIQMCPGFKKIQVCPGFQWFSISSSSILCTVNPSWVGSCTMADGTPRWSQSSLMLFLPLNINLIHTTWLLNLYHLISYVSGAADGAETEDSAGHVFYISQARQFFSYFFVSEFRWIKKVTWWKIDFRILQQSFQVSNSLAFCKVWNWFCPFEASNAKQKL